MSCSPKSCLIDHTFASIRNLRPSTINGALVNSSYVYCHSHVNCPNVPVVTNNMPLDENTKENFKIIHAEKHVD